MAVVLVAKILVPNIISKQCDLDETSAVLSIHAIMAAENDYAQAYDHGYSLARWDHLPKPCPTPH